MHLVPALQRFQVDLRRVRLELRRVETDLRRANRGRAAHRLAGRSLQQVVVSRGLDIQLLVATTLDDVVRT